MEDKGWNLSREELAEAAEASGVLNVLDDYVDETFTDECSCHLPDVEIVQAKDAARKCMELRSNRDLKMQGRQRNGAGWKYNELKII